MSDANQTKDARARRLTDRTCAEVLDLYRDSRERIFSALQRARRSPEIMAEARRKELLRAVGRELDRLADRMGERLRAALAAMADLAGAEAARDLRDCGLKEDAQGPGDGRSVEEAARSAQGHITAQTGRMLHAIERMLREEAAAVFRRASVEGTSRRKAYDLLRGWILGRDPDYRFVDRAGRRWESASYFEMLSRTLLAESMRESYVDALARAGVDLARIEGSSEPGDACRKWEGKVVSLTGMTQGHPTLAEAVASGEVFHPRCSHRLVACRPERGQG